jgi:hypothetical protein
MRVKGRSRRTPLLIALAVLLVAANVWWFGHERPAGEAPSFELADGSDQGRRSVATGISRAEIEAAPLYDLESRRWTVNGRAVTNLQAHLLTAPGSALSGRFLIARLPAEATTDDVRRVLLDLVERRICLVALPDATDPMAINVRRIVSVRNDAGRVVSCPS